MSDFQITLLVRHVSLERFSILLQRAREPLRAPFVRVLSVAPAFLLVAPPQRVKDREVIPQQASLANGKRHVKSF